MVKLQLKYTKQTETILIKNNAIIFTSFTIAIFKIVEESVHANTGNFLEYELRFIRIKAPKACLNLLKHRNLMVMLRCNVHMWNKQT